MRYTSIEITYNIVFLIIIILIQYKQKSKMALVGRPLVDVYWHSLVSINLFLEVKTGLCSI